MSPDLRVEVTDGVAVVRLDRPERRNAYTAEMGRLLSQAYRDCDDDDAVRAIVVTGAGDAFCVGADFGGDTGPFDAPPVHVAFTASPIDPPAFELRTPVIADVNGHAIGIGLTIVLQADIRILAESAKYAVAQVRRGVVPDCMSHWTLPRLAGVAAAAEVLLTGRTFDGREAVALGVATRAAPADAALDQAMALARDIAVNVAPMSAALCKRLLWDTVIHGYRPRQVAALETTLHHRLMGNADAAEGVAAFFERRAPRQAPATPLKSPLSNIWLPLPCSTASLGGIAMAAGLLPAISSSSRCWSTWARLHSITAAAVPTTGPGISSASATCSIAAKSASVPPRPPRSSDTATLNNPNSASPGHSSCQPVPDSSRAAVLALRVRANRRSASWTADCSAVRAIVTAARPSPRKAPTTAWR